jgi:hypothetical protein
MTTKASDEGPALQIRRRAWSQLIAELALRGGGHRESGAFLLGRRRGRRPRVTHVVYFDDLEPGSLNGAVHLTTSAYSELWAMCRDLAVEVLGDIHTHPGDMIGQSHIDEDNPLVAQAGHIALIVPHYARGTIDLRRTGVYEYRGDAGWTTRTRGLSHHRWF